MRLVQNGFANNFGLVGKTLRRALATTALTATGFAMLASPALADNWTDHVATEGTISIDTSVANTTNITQSTDFAKVSGDGDINAGWTVNVAQPSSSSKYVLYDIENDPTEIMGSLNANGRVFIFDQNGVIFGKNSQVNVGSIIATTGTISDANIKASKHVVKNVAGEGAIEMKGNISVADAGLAAFVAPTVVNSGVINAKMGNVVLASGEKVTIDLYGDNLIEVAVDGALENTLIKNSGAINANGGNVVISAKAAKDAVENVINMSGIVDVSSVSSKGGKIVLSGGKKSTVRVSGKLNASGNTKGGSVSVTGHKVNLTDTSEIVSTGDESNVYVYGTDKAIFRGTAVVGKDAALEISGRELVLGGSVTAGEGSTISFDPAIFDIGVAEAATIVSAMNNLGVTVDVAATDAINLNADIDTSAQATDSTLNFKDEDANNNLTVNLNAKIILGALQSLIGDATTVNVVANDGITQTALIQNGIDVAKDGVGAVVNVGKGIFEETIEVAKNNINIKGANAGIAGYSDTRGPETYVRPSGPLLPHTAYGFNITGDNVTIDGFTIMQFDNGIQANGVTGLNIRNNSITIANKDGIFVDGSNNIDIFFNEILATGHNHDGVHIANSSDVEMRLNAFGDPDPFWDINGDAIYFENVNGGGIYNNTVQGTRQFGDKDGNGIWLRDSSNINVGDGAFGYNVIHDAAWNGIWVQGGSNNNVLGNFVDHSDHAGILGETTSFLLIDDNFVEDSGWGGWGGITNIFGDNIQITNNEVFNYATSGSNVGISMAAVSGGNNIISGNNVHDHKGIGIHAFNNVNTEIFDNVVKNTGEHGIYLTNSSGTLRVDGNVIGVADGSSKIGWNGIWVQNIAGSDVSIADNQVYHAQANGIEVTNVEQTTTIARNLVNDTKERGLYVSGPSNGLVIVDDNDFNRFDEGGVFQSGTIDLVTGATNTFTNGRIGLLFSPYNFGEGFAFLDLVDDDGEPDTLFPDIPGNFDGSIGAQIFSNISEYYVELDNEAFFAPGFPTWLNGLNSTYDGLTPAGTLGALTQAELDALEAKFFHYIDRQDLGLFFLGFVPQPLINGVDINEALIFNQFDPFNGDATGLNVRVTGLPNTGVGGAGGGFAGPANLNNIQTFAGGTSPEDLNNIQTAAGGEGGNQPTAQDLGEIETEAGANSEATNCWSDAMNAAGGGQTVNVVYGGSFADNLNQAAACGTAF